MNEREDHYLEYLNYSIEHCNLYLDHCPWLTSADRRAIEAEKATKEQWRAEYLAAKRKECHG